MNDPAAPSAAPVIVGVTMQRRTPGDDCLLSLAPAYVRALTRAGATPLILPLFDTDGDPAADAAPLLSLCHGFLLTGSVADVHPRRYAGADAAIPADGFCDDRRDALDGAILAHSEWTRKPVFGICRGCQAMNVYRGGTLAWRLRDRWPDTTREHLCRDAPGGAAHAISWEKGAWLAARAPAETQDVNSLHRQACERLAPSLRAAAFSDDGLVEAIEDVRDPSRFFAVQWHPELLPDDPASAALFAHLVRACRTTAGASDFDPT